MVEQTATGLGSGVIVSEDGHVLTNHHVIDRAERITVRLSDGRSATARLVGSDPETDVALIKIENPNDGGDMSRSVGPYFRDELPPTAKSVFYQGLNRGKKSVTLDITDPDNLGSYVLVDFLENRRKMARSGR